MVVADLIPEAAAAGVRDYGITDHVHTPFNLPDLKRSRAEFLCANPSARFHFGVELSVVSTWELEEIAAGRCENPVYGLRAGGRPGCELALGVTAADLARYGVEYVIGGTHWPMYVPPERETVIRDYHRQNMFLVAHPLIDIVAHPWWWMGHWQDADGKYPDEPWLGDFRRIPASMHDEFASAAVSGGKKVEINLGANLLNRLYPERFKFQYLEYLAELKAHGVTLSLGSDCHAEHYAVDFDRGATMLAGVGIDAQDLWRLPPREPVA